MPAMLHRDVSPALSEQAFDISTALLEGQDVDGSGDINDLNEGESGDEEFILAQQRALNRKNANTSGKGGKAGGSFQTLGLNPILAKAITKKGFSVPTPIQRKTLPLILDGQDVVGMARTGSGKTAAFVIPMIEKLKNHSVKVGARALIMSPSRELALQTLKAVKDFGRGTDLRTVLLVGGDSLEEQFGQMSSNPDVIIATPGRFLHLLVEMSLDLASVKYVVFDEADRLFEMGFASQLSETLHKLPVSRQTLLFSATLPKSLVEFAKAGLREPSLVRLDAESKMSPDLESAFLAVKSAEKEGALLHILQDVIQMPTSELLKSEGGQADGKPRGKKRKRDSTTGSTQDTPTAHSTIVFAATKHHVEYLTALLRASDYAVSFVYGSLDQTARKMQVDAFRSGASNILVVTDVAARGIDIPLLANVINYDFPSQPKIFVHRVGRTARAGKKGWSYSLVADADLPYFLDLQLFLGKKLVVGRPTSSAAADFAQDMVIGSIPADRVEKTIEWVTRLNDDDVDIYSLHGVAAKGEKQYLRTRNAASSESARRAKSLAVTDAFRQPCLIYNDIADSTHAQRDSMLALIGGFRPAETVFEVGRRGHTDESVQSVRKRLDHLRRRSQASAARRAADTDASPDEPTDASLSTPAADNVDFDMDDSASEASVASNASSTELEVTFPTPSTKSSNPSTFHDPENYMPYLPASHNSAEDRGYGVASGSYDRFRGQPGAPVDFTSAARAATLDLTADESSRSFGGPAKPSQLRWDKRSKKYVSRANDEDGSRGARMITGESGQKIAASFRAGRFDAWRRANRVERLPRVGELEGRNGAAAAPRGAGAAPGARFLHRREDKAKAPDRFRDDFHKKRKRAAERAEAGAGAGAGAGSRAARGGKSGRGELRGAEDVRREREAKQKRRDKNARPARKRKV